MRKRGLTLIEVAFAVVLILVALLGVASVWVYGLRLSFQTSDTTVATENCRQLFEQIRINPQAIPAATTSFDGSLPSPALSGFPPPPYPSTTVDGNNYTFNITSGPVAGHSDVFQVVVDVFWKSGKKIELATHYYKP